MSEGIDSLITTERIGWCMTDELTTCAAAFFRSIGKDVTTAEEFVMTASLEMKWMSPSDSKLLLSALVSGGVLVRKGDFVRPSADLGAVDVPLAYRPSQEIMDTIHRKPEQKNPGHADRGTADAQPDPFHILMDRAVEAGMERRDFIQSCNKIQKRLNIDIGAAALIVLRDNGTDIAPYADMVYDSVRSA